MKWCGCLIVVFVVSVASSHVDPAGDIHPWVAVTQGLFVVTASENYFPSDADVVGELVMQYSPSGKLISEKRIKYPKPEFKPYKEYSYINELPEEKNGLERTVDGVTYIIPEYGRKHGGQPYLIKCVNGKFHELEIEWSRDLVGAVQDVVFSDDKIYFYLETHKDDMPELWIRRVSLKTLKEEAAGRFNIKPETIWGGAVTSNLMVHEGRCYVASVTTDFRGHRLMLGTWGGTSAQCRTKQLTRKVDWNTSLHMANIGEHAVITYHYPGGRSRRRMFPRLRSKQKDAQVQTLFFKLK